MGEPLGTDDPPAPERLVPESVRLVRRPEPRVSIALAGAGAVLAVAGALIVGGDAGSGEDSFNRWPGVTACAVLVAAGYLSLGLVKRGAIAAAGTVAAAVGVFALLAFLTLDETSGLSSADVILGVSTMVWLLTWALGPGRHRPFFLGAACIGAWLTLLELVEGVFGSPFGITTSFGPIGPVGPTGPDGVPLFPSDTGAQPVLFDTGPDPTMIGAISLVFGALYLIGSRMLDRRGRSGAATPLTVAGLITLAFGVGFLAPDLEAVGTGLLLILLGALVCLHGAYGRRRVSTWVGAAAVAVGILAILVDRIEGATAGGFSLVVSGVALVLIGHAVAAGWDEPDELEPVPSRFVAGGTIGAWPEPDDGAPPEPPVLPPHPPTT